MSGCRSDTSVRVRSCSGSVRAMSGRKFSFEVNRTSRAPAEALFRLETAGGRWSDWAKPIIMQSSWDRQGDPAPGGIGAVRKIGMWPLLVREETLEYERDRRHVYELIGPATPARDTVAKRRSRRTRRGAPICAGGARSPNGFRGPDP